jgi:Zn-dependent protease with chaperone function
MRIALVLVAYGLALAVLAPRLLTRSWTPRAPRLAIVAWQAICTAVLASAVLAGLALAVPTVSVSGGLADLLRSCVMALRAQYATPGGVAVSATGAVLALVVAVRVAWCLTVALAAARRERARHARALTLVGAQKREGSLTVVQDERPAAYCLPGRRHRIVLTSAALVALEPAALHAVIAHEQAHIRQRHHLALALADALANAFPRLPLFAGGRREIRSLVELAADDAACAHADPLALAEGLLSVAGAPAPAVALAAGGDAAARIRRLIAGRRPLPRPVARLGLLTAAFTLALPFALAAQPALAATDMNYCPLLPAASTAVPAR